MIESLKLYKDLVEEGLNELNLPSTPKNLYEPLNYFLNIGGKRMRPILSLLSAEMFSGEFKTAKGVALSVELFHNFSLIHDDIMDEAPLRRGNETVHKKWDLNVGILSGDALLIEAYKQLEFYEPKLFKPLSLLFNKTAIEVCEGQQYDMDFETRSDVTVAEYIHMIKLKTAVLLGCSLKMGAIIAKASEEDADRIYDFGVNLGIAFQLQDDYLDAFGNNPKVGKQVGGDIIANKKTYLQLTAESNASMIQLTELIKLQSSKEITSSEKVERTLGIYRSLNVPEKTKVKMQEFHDKAIESLNAISVNKDSKKALKALAQFLFSREY